MILRTFIGRDDQTYVTRDARHLCTLSASFARRRPYFRAARVENGKWQLAWILYKRHIVATKSSSLSVLVSVLLARLYFKGGSQTHLGSETPF